MLAIIVRAQRFSGQQIRLANTVIGQIAADSSRFVNKLYQPTATIALRVAVGQIAKAD